MTGDSTVYYSYSVQELIMTGENFAKLKSNVSR